MSKKKFRKFNRDEVFISKEEIEKFNTENARLLHLIRMSNPKGESVLFRLYNEYHDQEALNKFKCGCDVGSGKDKSVECIVTKNKGKINIIDDAIEVEKIKQELKQKALLSTIDQMAEFAKTLNERKNKKPMEITEESRIKDLIPEGYEFNWNRALWLEDEECISIPIRKKKKEVKDFKWYLNNYSRSKEYNTVEGRKISTQNYEDFSKTREGYFEHVSFEFKIGLLKFICDDIGMYFPTYISSLVLHTKYNDSKLKDICPPEFLNSIFK